MRTIRDAVSRVKESRTFAGVARCSALVALGLPLGCMCSSAPPTNQHDAEIAALQKKVDALEKKLSAAEQHVPSPEELKRAREAFLAEKRQKFGQAAPNPALEATVRSLFEPLAERFRGAVKLECRGTQCELRAVFPSTKALEGFTTTMLFDPQGPAWTGSSTTLGQEQQKDGSITVDLLLDRGPAPSTSTVPTAGPAAATPSGPAPTVTAAPAAAIPSASTPAKAVAPAAAAVAPTVAPTSSAPNRK